MLGFYRIHLMCDICLDLPSIGMPGWYHRETEPLLSYRMRTHRWDLYSTALLSNRSQHEHL